MSGWNIFGKSWFKWFHRWADNRSEILRCILTEHNMSWEPNCTFLWIQSFRRLSGTPALGLVARLKNLRLAHWRIEIKLSSHFSCLVTSLLEFDICIMCAFQCQESTLSTAFYRWFPQTIKFLWPMSVKYQKSTVEPAVSHLVPLFWPCRALTSLMKTGLPSCLFSLCLLTRRRKLSAASQQQKTLHPRAQQ